MKVIIKFEDNDYEYEIPIEKLLPYLKVKKSDIEYAAQQAIRKL